METQVENTSDDVRKAAQEEAERTFAGFINFSKYITYAAIAFLLIVASCNFGVDGTGSKSNPELYEEYKDRMEDMKERIKKEKYG